MNDFINYVSPRLHKMACLAHDEDNIYPVVKELVDDSRRAKPTHKYVHSDTVETLCKNYLRYCAMKQCYDGGYPEFLSGALSDLIGKSYLSPYAFSVTSSNIHNLSSGMHKQLSVESVYNSTEQGLSSRKYPITDECVKYYIKDGLTLSSAFIDYAICIFNEADNMSFDKAWELAKEVTLMESYGLSGNWRALRELNHNPEAKWFKNFCQHSVAMIGVNIPVAQGLVDVAEQANTVQSISENEWLNVINDSFADMLKNDEVEYDNYKAILMLVSPMVLRSRTLAQAVALKRMVEFNQILQDVEPNKNFVYDKDVFMDKMTELRPGAGRMPLRILAESFMTDAKMERSQSLF